MEDLIMETVHEGRIVYPAPQFGKGSGECELHLIRRLDGVYVCTMTEPDTDYSGVSVTNGCNDIAAFVVKTFELPSPETTIWIEHYTDRAIGEEETWARIFMTWDPKWRQYCNTTWSHLTPDQAAELKKTPDHV